MPKKKSKASPSAPWSQELQALPALSCCPRKGNKKVKGRLFERTKVIKIKSISSAEREPLEGYEAFPSCSPLLFLCLLPRQAGAEGSLRPRAPVLGSHRKQ